MRDNVLCQGDGRLAHDTLVLLHGTCVCGDTQSASAPKVTVPAPRKAEAPTRGHCEKRGDNIVYVTQTADGFANYRFLAGGWS